MSGAVTGSAPCPGGGARVLDPEDVWRQASDAFSRWTAGDSVALDDLVAAMTPVLWHMVRSYRLSQEAAEDVIQSTWLALVRSRSSIVDPGAVGAWLTTAARREAWRVVKAGGRAVAVEDEELGRRLPETASAESEVVEADRRRALWEAVDQLPERCRRLLRIVAFEHRPDYSRVSVDLDMPVGSIGPTRGRCLAKLKSALEKGAVL